jgi:hypothetical protein
MTGTNCDLFTHKSSRSYLNHLVLHICVCVCVCVCACVLGNVGVCMRVRACIFAIHIRHFATSFVPPSGYISTLSHKKTDFRKKSSIIKCVFWFSLQLLSKPFPILRRTWRNIATKVYHADLTWNQGILVEVTGLVSDTASEIEYFHVTFKEASQQIGFPFKQNIVCPWDSERDFIPSQLVRWKGLCEENQSYTQRRLIKEYLNGQLQILVNSWILKTIHIVVKQENWGLNIQTYMRMYYSEFVTSVIKT